MAHARQRPVQRLAISRHREIRPFSRPSATWLRFFGDASWLSAPPPTAPPCSAWKRCPCFLSLTRVKNRCRRSGCCLCRSWVWYSVQQSGMFSNHAFFCIVRLQQRLAMFSSPFDLHRCAVGEAVFRSRTYRPEVRSQSPSEAISTIRSGGEFLLASSCFSANPLRPDAGRRPAAKKIAKHCLRPGTSYGKSPFIPVGTAGRNRHLRPETGDFSNRFLAMQGGPPRTKAPRNAAVAQG